MADITVLRQLYESRRLEEAWAEYERLRQGPTGPEAHFYGALTARLLQDFRGARSALERAVEAGPVGRIKGQVVMTMGVLLLHIGDTQLAYDYLQDFLAGMDEYPELASVAVASAWYNLGLVYRSMRRLDDAVYAYEQAAAACRRDDQPELLRKTLQNLSWICCLLEYTSKAEEALCEADDLCSSSEARWHQRIGMAFLEAVTGEHEEALRRCESIVSAADTAPPVVISQAYWVSGRVALVLGHLDLALEMANQAVDWSLKVKDEIRPMQDANELRRQIYIARMEKNRGA